VALSIWDGIYVPSYCTYGRAIGLSAIRAKYEPGYCYTYETTDRLCAIYNNATHVNRFQGALARCVLGPLWRVFFDDVLVLSSLPCQAVHDACERAYLATLDLTAPNTSPDSRPKATRRHRCMDGPDSRRAAKMDAMIERDIH